MTYPLFEVACFKLNRYWSENLQVIPVVAYVKLANLKYCIFSLVPTNRKKTQQGRDSNSLTESSQVMIFLAALFPTTAKPQFELSDFAHKLRVKLKKQNCELSFENPVNSKMSFLPSSDLFACQ